MAFSKNLENVEALDGKGVTDSYRMTLIVAEIVDLVRAGAV